MEDKSALNKSETVNKQIRKLSRYKQVSDTLEGLKENDTHQQTEINRLKGSTDIHKREIDVLQEYSGVAKLDNKEKAYLMYSNGVTQKAVSDELGISIATVKRYWRDFKRR